MMGTKFAEHAFSVAGPPCVELFLQISNLRLTQLFLNAN